jgi:CelD/BcsL family acetyltransferase involved in cellulose biosynthesis
MLDDIVTYREHPHDLGELGREWRTLEAAVPHSFFQSWTWVGCLFSERYPDPVIIRAERNGKLVGLALFNRRSSRMYLSESGDPAADSPFIEHNGPLATDAAVLSALFRAAWKGASRLVLSGIPTAIQDVAGGISIRSQERAAPFVDLIPLHAPGNSYLQTLSANTRYQLRRSARCYGGEDAITIARPANLAELRLEASELMRLHGASWNRRGKPGAFGTVWQRRFHIALMERAYTRGELDLLRVEGPSGLIGLLYNFRLNGKIYAYQSGFMEEGLDTHAKPGMTCHVTAINEAVAHGRGVYDFLAGDQRYKRSLAHNMSTLAWVELARPWSPTAILFRSAAAVRKGFITHFPVHDAQKRQMPPPPDFPVGHLGHAAEAGLPDVRQASTE